MSSRVFRFPVAIKTHVFVTTAVNHLNIIAVRFPFTPEQRTTMNKKKNKNNKVVTLIAASGGRII